MALRVPLNLQGVSLQFESNWWRYRVSQKFLWNPSRNPLQIFEYKWFLRLPNLLGVWKFSVKSTTYSLDVLHLTKSYSTINGVTCLLNLHGVSSQITLLNKYFFGCPTGTKDYFVMVSLRISGRNMSHIGEGVEQLKYSPNLIKQIPMTSHIRKWMISLALLTVRIIQILCGSGNLPRKRQHILWPPCVRWKAIQRKMALRVPFNLQGVNSQFELNQ